ncbi:MAG TPA: ABC transporter ATP-binding protein [Roseateles sp.]|uniref:ABC transporter ATP-binding protein n=1 Tax=Roseateles sp. TaxID=1971397 RepID=UPI002EDA3F7A
MLFLLAGTLVVVAISGALAATAPLALKHLVDAMAVLSMSSADSNGTVLIHGVFYLLVLAGGRLASDVRPLLSGRIEQRVLMSLRQRFFAHLLLLRTGDLAKRRSGELLHSAELAAVGVRTVISHVTGTMVPVLVELILMAFILVQLRLPALLGVFIAASAAYLMVFGVGVLRQRDAVKSLSAASLDAYGRLADGIANIETLRCFGAGAQAQATLAGASSRLMTRWLQFNRLTAQSALAASMVFTVAMSACFAIASAAVANSQMTTGGFVLVIVYMLQIVRPLEMLGAAARDFSRASGFIKPMLDILDSPIDPAEPSSATPRKAWDPPSTAPSLRIENLQFGYDPNKPVIRGLDLEIQAGHTTAIVGRSGCGKSSLARLLLRLYTPQAGRILIDGQPIEAMSTHELRAMFGLVPQDAGLLHGSVRDNIALGRQATPIEDIEQAATHAQIHRRIRALPDGYDTLLGERGQTISGGERQRLAIARAMLRRPKIYLLDEPTSMLDAKTEAEVMAELRTMTAGCTTLLIAHRLSTVMHADEVVVIDDGQVRERGRHADLLEKNGLYAQLWRQQTG